MTPAERDLLERCKRARARTPTLRQPATGTTRLRDTWITRLLRRLGVYWSVE